ncbi:unnamed protein product, partial [marine sediment metagenome]
KDTTLKFNQGNFTLGSSVYGYGITVSQSYKNDSIYYGINPTSDLLRLNGLSLIEPFAVVGIKEGIPKYNFVKDNDWKVIDNPTTSLEHSSIEFIGDHPDNDTVFTIVYKFEFNFTEGYYGNISLNSDSNKGILKSWIKFEFLNDVLNKEINDFQPLYISFEETLPAGLSQYNLSYGIQNLTLWEDNVVIYNEHELQPFNGSINTNGYPTLTFATTQTEDVTVIYGIRSQYNLGYGFQRLNGSYND